VSCTSVSVHGLLRRLRKDWDDPPRLKIILQSSISEKLVDHTFVYVDRNFLLLFWLYGHVCGVCGVVAWNWWMIGHDRLFLLDHLKYLVSDVSGFISSDVGSPAIIQNEKHVVRKVYFLKSCKYCVSWVLSKSSRLVQVRPFWQKSAYCWGNDQGDVHWSDDSI